MNIAEYIISAGRCLGANKFRTLLTTLGIIVGISSVIFITTLGNSLGKTITDVIYSLYSGNQACISFKPSDGTEVEYDDEGYYDYPENIAFTPDMIKAYSDKFGDVASRVVSTNMMDQSSQVPGRITVTDENYSDVMVVPSSEGTKVYNLVKITSGRFINKTDEENKAACAVISDIAAKHCFGKEDPIGKQTVINTADGNSLPCVIVGVYQYIDMGLVETAEDERELNTSIYLPYTYIHEQSGTYEENTTTEYFTVKNIDDINKFKEETADFFNSYVADTGWETDVYMLTDEISSINTVVKIITLIISGIAAIALFVGGIGVMNIMLVSVTERTMEIGVRKAMGASNKSIKIQFLTESIVISLIGAIIGILWGLIQSRIVAIIAVRIAKNAVFDLSVDLSVPYAAIIGAVLFSFVIGIGFGVYPANKAAKMQVVDALRYE
ncbi:MAG: ABC transporter permease [Oscillospiraceae bacterium]|nr:ABC transporter permease [Oscillospiraceae bacterium]